MLFLKNEDMPKNEMGGIYILKASRFFALVSGIRVMPISTESSIPIFFPF